MNETVSHDDCIEWDMALFRNGYGKVWHNGRVRRVHRVVWEEENGRIRSKKLVVCHRCDNRACINIEHLFLGTAFVNMRDMVAKGRHAAQRRTHCPRGHELAGENLRLSTLRRRGVRQCRICTNEKARERCRRQRERSVSIDQPPGSSQSGSSPRESRSA